MMFVSSQMTQEVAAEEKESSIKIITAAEINGEDNKNGFMYLSILWLVSLIAMVTNIAQAVFRKILNPKKSFPVILWEMGRSEKHVSSWFVDKFSKFNHESKTGAAGWKSLQIFYNYHEYVRPKLKNDFQGYITRFWIERMANRQAVTNRKKAAISFLEQAFRKFAGEDEVRLLSVASGSAEAVFAAMEEVSWMNIKVVLIDNDQSALDEAMRVAKDKGLIDKFTAIKGTTTILEEVADEFKPHMVEMFGFLDYRPHNKAVELIQRIKKVLPEGGFFFTCNIVPNIEKIFLDWVLLWPMIYRSPEVMHQILVEAGFSPGKINVFLEPHKIHTIGVCEK